MKQIRFLLIAATISALGCDDKDHKLLGDATVIDDPSSPDASPQPDSSQAACTPVSGTNLGLEEVTSGLDMPTFVTSPPGDPRLFIVELTGRIILVEDGVRLPLPFIDLSEAITNIEYGQGLFGLAFHPDYATNGRFFVNYTAASPLGDTVVAEYQVSADRNVADTTEKRLLVVDQPFSNSNGGMLAFGPDGYLYIGMGDGGSSGDPLDHGENTATLLGSLLRIDVDNGDPYDIPPTNPFADSPNGPMDPRPETWAYGLRNPWRFSFDRITGDLYIADTGEHEWEEVNVQPAASTGGENYGWNTMEGTHCFEPAADCDMTGKILPVTEYGHEGAGCTGAVIGGYVYRGTCMPDVQGRYFYADFCFDRMWTFTYANGQATDEQELAMPLALSVSSFGEDANGELYVVSLNGAVYRIVAGQ